MMYDSPQILKASNPNDIATSMSANDKKTEEDII